LQTIAQLSADYPYIRPIGVVKGKPFEMTPEHFKRLHDFEGLTLFILTERFLLRRFLHQRIQKQNVLFRAQEKLPIQTVRFVGLGPTPDMLTKKITRSVQNSSHVILFDRTLENIVRGIQFTGHTYVLPYGYEDFSLNLLALNLMLAALQAAGVYHVTVLVEGNPEIYDFAEGLSTVSRQFTYEVSAPLVLFGCQWLEKRFRLDFINPSYILTSGFNARQGITTTELLNEIIAYLETDFTFMVMEMYCGDIPLVLSQVQQSVRSKSVVILTNMFSPDQRVYFLPFRQLYRVDWVERIKGKFTTFIIIDNQRLPVGTPVYEYIVNECGPNRNPD
jgi:hypothetical protein